MKSSQCDFAKSNGQRCRARRISGSKYCFHHDPKKTEKRREAKVAGGKKGKADWIQATLPQDAPDVSIEKPEDIKQLIGDTINQVRRGQLSPQVANSVGYLVNIAIKAIESGKIEERLKRLEEAIEAGPQVYGKTG